MLPGCHLETTLKKCLIQISAINWGNRRKAIQQALDIQPQKDWIQENTMFMTMQSELVSLSVVLIAQKKFANARTDTQAIRNSRDIANLYKKELQWCGLISPVSMGSQPELCAFSQHVWHWRRVWRLTATFFPGLLRKGIVQPNTVTDQLLCTLWESISVLCHQETDVLY